MGNKDSIRIEDENWSNIPEGGWVSEVPLFANLHLVILGLQVLEVGIVLYFTPQFTLFPTSVVPFPAILLYWIWIKSSKMGIDWGINTFSAISDREIQVNLNFPHRICNLQKFKG